MGPNMKDLRLYSFALILAVLTGFAQSAAQDFYVPENLKPWLDWVKGRHPDLSCAAFHEGGSACLWPGKLSLNIAEDGGSFEYAVVVDSKYDVQIPSSRESQPFDIKVTRAGKTQAATVLSKGETPQLHLNPGNFKIQGNFKWKDMPKTLTLPRGAAILELTLNGERIEYPRVSERGELWLEDSTAEISESQDALKINVFRKLVDGLPFRIITRLELRVSGKTRTLELGRILPDGSQPLSVDSPLPYQFGPDYALSMQLIRNDQSR